MLLEFMWCAHFQAQMGMHLIEVLKPVHVKLVVA